MRRVVVTGAGVVSPVGIGRAHFQQALVEGRSGVARLSNIADPQRLRVGIGAQVLGFDPLAHFPAQQISSLDRFSQFGLVAAREAMAQAAMGDVERLGAGTYFATGMGGAITLEHGYDAVFRQGLNRIPSLSVIAAMPNAAGANIGIEFGLRGPSYTYAVACASSAVAIGEAFRAIRAGWIDSALAGGSESIMCFGMIKAWEGLMTLAVEDRDAPQTSCRPFAVDRTGFVLGEGAAALVLEEREQALARGATILAELVGFGSSNDAQHLSRPSTSGQVRAMRQALAEAAACGVSADAVVYINAHGTATKAGDAAEVASIVEVFGDRARHVAISSTKAVHGHLLGAGGAVEFVAALGVLENGVAPPTAHLTRPDPAFDLDFVPCVARDLGRVEAVMSNSFAFGGSNAVLVASRP